MWTARRLKCPYHDDKNATDTFKLHLIYGVNKLGEQEVQTFNTQHQQVAVFSLDLAAEKPYVNKSGDHHSLIQFT